MVFEKIKSLFFTGLDSEMLTEGCLRGRVMVPGWRGAASAFRQCQGRGDPNFQELNPPSAKAGFIYSNQLSCF